jgi:hypothetical protein
LLQSTLERRGRPSVTVDDYYRLIAVGVKPQLESFTGQRFDATPYPVLRRLLREYDKFSLALTGGKFPAAAYMIHTRHHGFPSPLMDWTRSAYIAAFFAFAAAEDSRVRRRSIYIWERGAMWSHGTNSPELHRLGPYITTHRRHVLQQCDYSYCVRFDTGAMTWSFIPQEEAFDRACSFQDRLWKFNIPSKERSAVLRYLDTVNLNAYSLLGSEESLMETLAIREFDLRSAP